MRNYASTLFRCGGKILFHGEKNSGLCSLWNLVLGSPNNPDVSVQPSFLRGWKDSVSVLSNMAATGGYWALAMWLGRLRGWIFILFHFNEFKFKLK